jgi:hypothetical protein
MAVTINQEPQQISPVGNYLTFTFDSDQTGQANFSFYVEVYINSSFHSAHTIFPENSANARIDVSGILRTFVSSNIPSSIIEEDYSNALTEYAIIVYERYGTPPINQASDTSTTLQIFNGSLRYPEFVNWDYTQYDPATVQGALFLTSFPRSEKAYVKYNDNFYLSQFITVPLPAGTYSIFIELYDISGNIIISDAFFPSFSTDFILLNVKPANIVANTLISQNDFDQCYYYSVNLDYGGATTSEAFIIYYDQTCERYDPIRLLWLNKFGVWDSYSFDLVSQESSDVTSSRYEGEPGTWVGSDYKYTLSKGMNRTYHKHAVDKLLINSDWMKEAVQNWLVRELFESPVVYIQQSDGSVELVNVTNANYLLKQRRKDGLIQEQILLEKTYISNSQLI